MVVHQQCPPNKEAGCTVRCTGPCSCWRREANRSLPARSAETPALPATKRSATKRSATKRRERCDEIANALDAAWLATKEPVAAASSAVPLQPSLLLAVLQLLRLTRAQPTGSGSLWCGQALSARRSVPRQTYRGNFREIVSLGGDLKDDGGGLRDGGDRSGHGVWRDAV
jgi:hypothetical protein